MATVLADRHPVARVAHQCDLCLRRINPGERYQTQFSTEGTFRCCAHCEAFASVVWASGQVDDAQGADWSTMLDFEPRTLAELRLKALHRRQWTRKDGTLMPVPHVVWARLFYPRHSWDYPQATRIAIGLAA